MLAKIYVLLRLFCTWY